MRKKNSIHRLFSFQNILQIWSKYLHCKCRIGRGFCWTNVQCRVFTCKCYISNSFGVPLSDICNFSRRFALMVLDLVYVSRLWWCAMFGNGFLVMSKTHSNYTWRHSRKAFSILLPDIKWKEKSKHANIRFWIAQVTLYFVNIRSGNYFLLSCVFFL